jgi:hypothetical protein
MGETTSGSDRIPAPAGLPSEMGTFVVAEIRAVDSQYASWSVPVRATFRRTQGGWKLVGLERMPDGPEVPSKP